MSFKSSSVVALRPVASGVAPTAVSEEGSEWRALGGVAFAILADLDRRRPKLVVSPQREQETKAA